MRRSLLGEAPTWSELEDRLDDGDDSRAWIAVAGPSARAVGALRLVGGLERGEAVVSFEVVVAPPFWRRGYGRRIVAQVEDLAVAGWGTRLVTLGVFADNTAAVALYTVMGFGEIRREWIEVGRRRRRALIMANEPAVLRGRRIGFGAQK